MYLDVITEADESAEPQVKLPPSTSNKPAVFKHRAILDIAQANKDIEDARDEWDNLDPVTPSSSVLHPHTEPITCNELLDNFRSKNMDEYLKNIKPVRSKKRLTCLKRWLLGPPQLSEDLVSDRNLMFAIALCPFDSSDLIHVRVLQTLYKSLTDSQEDCPRYGKHWEDLGFQGSDPATDLRGVGFLGLLHLLYLSLNPDTADLAKKISLLSQTENQNFPFCTMGINISRIVLEAMREEVLNSECNHKMDVFLVTNNFYVGIFLRLYTIWCKQNKTIMDSGYVIKDLTNEAKKHSSVILKDLVSYLQTSKSLEK